MYLPTSNHRANGWLGGARRDVWKFAPAPPLSLHRGTLIWLKKPELQHVRGEVGGQGAGASPGGVCCRPAHSSGVGGRTSRVPALPLKFRVWSWGLIFISLEMSVCGS